MRSIIAMCIVCLPLKSLTVTSPFGYRSHPLTGKLDYHTGIDFRANYDTVYAVLNGVVRSVDFTPNLGMAINLQHGELNTIYGHLSKSLVALKDTVIAGQPIAISGATGHVTAAHLHFSVRYQKRYLNPLNFLYQILKITDHEQKF
ncbi:Peptidase family M23 [Mucilaginibacter gossypiicola]|uniref:Peptidase family M23 n=1 Tax=Mucilaginibacter gossypiicola TaxID=551995 RepID=A0A1H8D4T8_9SPHI|nr:M23 family metallopeptidase [Mucilaginibacter gossypiicola]SEN02293.1 Peptidase family M23 [Mucilaginibacter gossypiicola]